MQTFARLCWAELRSCRSNLAAVLQWYSIGREAPSPLAPAGTIRNDARLHHLHHRRRLDGQDVGVRVEQHSLPGQLIMMTLALHGSSNSHLALSVRHEYEYCDVCVNRSDDNTLDVCFQESQLTSDPTTTPQQCTKEIDNSANRADLPISETCPQAGYNAK